jgi:hypothetical protein
MCHDVWHTAFANLVMTDLAKLILGLFSGYFVEFETSLGVIDQAVVGVDPINGHNIHEACRIGGVRANLAINFDEPLHHDRRDFLVGQRIPARFGLIEEATVPNVNLRA